MTALINPFEREVKKLIVPLHVSWSFGGEEFAPIDQHVPFVFEYKNLDWGNPGDLKTAVREGIRRLSIGSGKPLAICLSGSDSEIIAREAHRLALPFELYFLNIWGNNTVEQGVAAEIAKEFGKTLNVVHLDKDTAFASVIPANFAKLGAAKPTYLVLPYLFQRIPATMFIVCGEGDPDKNHSAYKFGPNEIPIGTTEIFYRQWALENNRDGEFYFYASTPELVVSYTKHPLISRSENVISTTSVKYMTWPELKYRNRTNNWTNVKGSNLEVRQFVANGDETILNAGQSSYNVLVP